MKTLKTILIASSILVSYSLSDIRKVPQDYLTIQEAIDSCSFLDTIFVDKGEYPGSIVINKPLTIIGIHKDSVILYSNDYGFNPDVKKSIITIKADDVNIQNLKIKKGAIIAAAEINIDSSRNVKIERLHLEGQDGLEGYYPDGGNIMTISSSQNIYLLSVFMYAGTGSGAIGAIADTLSAGDGGYGIDISYSQNITIDSCSIYGGDGGSASHIHFLLPAGKNGNSIILKDSSIVSVHSSKLKYAIAKDSSSSITLTNTEIVLTSIIEIKPRSSFASDFQLFQNYPNPFNPSTTINFSLYKSDFVTLKVVDVLGREVAKILFGYLQKGNYSKRFSASYLSSGMYFYTLTTSSSSQTRQFILHK